MAYIITMYMGSYYDTIYVRSRTLKYAQVHFESVQNKNNEKYISRVSEKL